MHPQTPGRALAVALLALLLVGPSTLARAEAPWSPTRIRAGRERTLALDVESELKTLPALHDVRAEVALPDPLAGSADAPPEAPRVVVWLTPDPNFSSREVLEPEARALVRRTLGAGNLTEVTLHWQDPPNERAPAWQQVGPFRVESHSAGPLRAALLTLLGATFALSALLLRYLERGRRRPPS